MWPLAANTERFNRDTCNITCDLNFDQSVELTFRPAQAIRLVEEGRYFCVGGPQSRPHVLAQQYLLAGGERVLEVSLAPGRYRLRAQLLSGGAFLRVEPGGASSICLDAQTGGWPVGEQVLGPSPTLKLANRTAQPQLFILERTHLQAEMKVFDEPLQVWRLAVRD